MTSGRAALYSRNKISTPIPSKIPISNRKAKQLTKVTMKAIRSISGNNKTELIYFFEKIPNILFMLQIVFVSATSTIKTTAQIITAANVAFGIKLKYGVRNVKASITIPPVRKQINQISNL